LLFSLTSSRKIYTMPEDDNPQGGNQAEALQKLLDKKNGDAMGVAMMLLSENFGLREKNRQLKEKVPADGTVLLSKEEAEQFNAFKALNLKPEEIKTKVTDYDKVVAERDSLNKVKLLREVADAGYSFDGLKTFDDLEGKDIEYVIREETKDGKQVKSVSVKAEGKEMPLDDFVAQKRPALASILKSEGAQGGTRIPNMPAGGKAPQKNEFDEIREKAKAEQEGKKAPSVHERFGLAKTA
jgi:hypothetical protein